MLEPVLNRNEIAEILDLTPGRVTQLMQSGVLPRSDGKYRLKETVHAYIAFLKNRRKTNPEELQAAKLEHTQQQARDRKLRADKLEATLVDRAEMERRFSELGAEYMALWQSLPPRLSRELALNADQARGLQAAIEETLRQFSETLPDPEPQPVNLMDLLR